MKMKRLVLLTLMTGVLLGGSGWASLAQAEEAKVLRLPMSLLLSEQTTTVYSEPGGTALFALAPQFVKVKGAEEGWEQKLIYGEQPEVWFRIETDLGERWIKVSNPELDPYEYETVLLTGSEKLYDSPKVTGTSAGTVGAQAVRAIHEENGAFRILSYNGYKWIRPVHRIIRGLGPHWIGESSISLRTRTPLFKEPDAGGTVQGWLSAQSLRTSESYGSWYKVDTWQGSYWVNWNIGDPWDLRQEETKLTLGQKTAVYEHPDHRARKLGELSPQTIEVFERGSGWHHIRSSWLGDAWVYAPAPAVDPLTYQAPEEGAVVEVKGTWTALQLDPASTYVAGYPISPTVGTTNNQNQNTLTGALTYGKPIKLYVMLSNSSEEALRLQGSQDFLVEIVRYDEDRTNPVIVWTGRLPALTAAFPGRMASQVLELEWDQRDSEGKQVPSGRYEFRIKEGPVTYIEESTNEKKTQDIQSDMRSRRPIDIAAP
ncbi:hypothetical protein [Paenibacillus mucilaginosus]|uniref:Intracellular proteinase inhibitor BsuPI domain-containing protein n=1 Tax=Paenibacillus mucilaginosus (strain KNP414) TaxID=1036673 RepID=F8FE32_PAEMK|nr:hypothetical protein [Paenibacillus mucilaginosus]AEI43791.1 hypothetical protein KNP414_05267 [Paenibacillus mucilaginosus KNP414]MCG7212690.1 hypothetical protein [Paenibacillus mucilaginosus]WDM25291.1 hypothetical protein KCX80_22855 [Paenibacillus mucilaginosus]